LKDGLRIKQGDRPIVGLFISSLFIVCPSSFVKADGGAMRLRERAGNYQITVFTSPTPLRVGPVDISVLAQDATSGNWVPDMRVTVRLMARGTHQTLEYQATTEAATNKLLQSAVFQLPEAGLWDVEAALDGPRGHASVFFEVDAAEPPPRWLEMWPWFTWPALLVTLFGIHQVLVQRKVR
jgi:hypothetical protein